MDTDTVEYFERLKWVFEQTPGISIQDLEVFLADESNRTSWNNFKNTLRKVVDGRRYRAQLQNGLAKGTHPSENVKKRILKWAHTPSLFFAKQDLDVQLEHRYTLQEAYLEIQRGDDERQVQDIRQRLFLYVFFECIQTKGYFGKNGWVRGAVDQLVDYIEPKSKDALQIRKRLIDFVERGHTLYCWAQKFGHPGYLFILPPAYCVTLLVRPEIDEIVASCRARDIELLAEELEVKKLANHIVGVLTIDLKDFQIPELGFIGQVASSEEDETTLSSSRANVAGHTAEEDTSGSLLTPQTTIYSHSQSQRTSEMNSTTSIDHTDTTLNPGPPSFEPQKRHGQDVDQTGREKRIRSDPGSYCSNHEIATQPAGDAISWPHTLPTDPDPLVLRTSDPFSSNFPENHQPSFDLSNFDIDYRSFDLSNFSSAYTNGNLSEFHTFHGMYDLSDFETFPIGAV